MLGERGMKSPGIRRGREIKDSQSQQDERKKLFHNHSGVWLRTILNMRRDVKNFPANRLPAHHRPKRIT
jgi:hypothetical protein